MRRVYYVFGIGLCGNKLCSMRWISSCHSRCFACSVAWTPTSLTMKPVPATDPTPYPAKAWHCWPWPVMGCVRKSTAMGLESMAMVVWYCTSFLCTRPQHLERSFFRETGGIISKLCQFFGCLFGQWLRITFFFQNPTEGDSTSAWWRPNDCTQFCAINHMPLSLHNLGYEARIGWMHVWFWSTYKSTTINYPMSRCEYYVLGMFTENISKGITCHPMDFWSVPSHRQCCDSGVFACERTGTETKGRRRRGEEAEAIDSVLDTGWVVSATERSESRCWIGSGNYSAAFRLWASVCVCPMQC